LDGPLFFQTQIGLVHQSCALQSVLRTFFPQVAMRDPTQFRVNERDSRVQGFVFAGVPVRQ
jgi:hypothetical protein